MPKEFDDCVAGVKKSGKPDKSAYAICVSSYMKIHGKSPFKKESDMREAGVPEEIINLLKKIDENSSPSDVFLVVKALESMGSGASVKIIKGDFVR